jgi:hypothetical protein
MVKHFMAAIAALILLGPGAANAQVPSYAQPPEAAPVNDDLQIRGRVASFDGEYGLSIRDERGYLDNVRLHPGTIINPTGITLQPGMIVSVIGYNAGEYLDANEIDTPYAYYGGIPYYAGHPWNYYGPGIGFDFFFGNAGWWHGGYFRGGYTYVGGARVYSSVRVMNVYRGGGGAYHGRAYVVPRSRGGYYAHARGAEGHEGREEKGR